MRTHVCVREGVRVHAVSHDFLDLRVGGGPIHTTWTERAGELRVLFLEEREGMDAELGKIILFLLCISGVFNQLTK